MLRLLFPLTLVLVMTVSSWGQNYAQCSKCGRIHVVQQRQPGFSSQPVNSGRRAADGYPIVYCAPGYESAYAKCVNDCQYYAQGNRYPGRYGGHPPWNLGQGLAAGTGYSWDANRPNHCYNGTRRKRLVARARVVDSRGRAWWSARYK